MSLDERHPRWQHADLRRSYDDEREADRAADQALEAAYYESYDPFAGWVLGAGAGDNWSTPDSRTFPSMGTDEVDCWRHPVLPDAEDVA